jgi:hypothetical protein
MAHYAFLDENNIVTEVIVGVDENITQTDIDGTQVGGSSDAWEIFYGNFRGQTCKRTSYNSWAGKRKDPETNELTDEVGFRKNYGGIGWTYDATRDAFIPPKPFASWLLNDETCLWDAPIPKPDIINAHNWIEETGSWELIVSED